MTWADLDRELDAWAADDRIASFWWRDDDAQAPNAALDRLLDIAAEAEVPVALAVIPACAAPELAERLGGIAVLQHGFFHANHAPADEKKAELGPHRPLPAMAAELAAGRARLDEIFGESTLPILVPPWNRITTGLLPLLPDHGFAGISTYRARRRACAAPGLTQVNCHLDPIDWRGTRSFLGEGASLAAAIGHLRARRDGAADPVEPTGLLTHHLVLDTAAWHFVARFLSITARHPAVRWLDAAAAFAVSP